MTERFIEKDGKRLRTGFTTGACAAAAAKGAALMLLTGQALERVELVLPMGARLELPLADIRRRPDSVSCGVVKDAGDDPDVTGGVTVMAEVWRTAAPGITVEGGPGVGRVTKPGLDRPVGEAAINSVPLRMIREGLAEALERCGAAGGLRAVISVPGGETLAEKTFNPRLGIVGGISILGTTGVVEPMSDAALLDTVRTELRQRRACGEEYALLTPGNYGLEYLGGTLGLRQDRAVLVSNFLRDAVAECRTLGFRGALLVGHAGKLVKLAGGIANTHSRYGDCRMELVAAHAAAAGLPAGGVLRILDCASVDAACAVLEEFGLREETFRRLAERADFYLRTWGGSDMETGAVLFSRTWGRLACTPAAPALLERLRGGSEEPAS